MPATSQERMPKIARFFSSCTASTGGGCACADFQQALDVREDVALRGIVGVRQMDLDGVAVGIGDRVEIRVAAAAAERRDDLVVLPQQVHDLQKVICDGSTVRACHAFSIFTFTVRLPARYSVLACGPASAWRCPAGNRGHTPCPFVLLPSREPRWSPMPPPETSRIFVPSRIAAPSASAGFISTKPSG